VTFGPLVSGGWLAGHLDQVRVVDVRWYLDGRSGRAAYESGHLPGAVWLDIDTDLSEAASPQAGRHPLPSPQRFAAALGRAGIHARDRVVAYDDTGGSTAARLWYLLRVLNRPAAVLDGGLDAWPGGLVTTEPDYPPVRRRPQPWPPERFVTAEELAQVPDAVVYDARTAPRFAHGDRDIDPRPGHIPGAVSAPWAGNLDEQQRFRSTTELRDRYADALQRPAIAYCGSGVTACHNLLALEVAGIQGTALYPGSWSQWGNDPDRPAEVGTSRR
jgi:thiosulfate/3-mercaptopyruvate sulfurtransferase